jgi:electron-transferring-flavoprotein dehydrogenase
MTKHVKPADYPPPVDQATEFVTKPSDPEDERIEVGIAIVGGGPAGLACAIKVMQLLENDPELLESLGEVPVAVIEKGKTCGAHLLSGANMRPSAMQELFPDLDPSEWPVYGEVKKDATYLLSKHKAVKLVPNPPPMRNHGNYVTSVSELGRWLAEKAEEMGVYVLSETTAQKLLVEDGKVVGIRTGDRGQDREGNPMPNFEPGSDVIAKATVIAEGTVGHLTMAALDFFGMHPKSPQRWEIGVKEVWEVPKPLDGVIHTMGYPLRKGAKYNEFGGSFIYPMGGVHRAGDRSRLHRRHALVPRPAAGAQAAPVHQEDPRRWQACRLGRQDDPLGWLLVDPQQADRPRHDPHRRRGRPVQHLCAERRPLRDALGHVRG